MLSCLDIECNPEGISVIGVNGKNQIPKYWRLYSKFEIPIIIIFDNDNSVQKVNSNKNIANCFGLSVNDIINDVNVCKLIDLEAYPKTKIVVLEQDFETAFRKELTNQGFEDSYSVFELEAKELIKPIGNQQKGVIARYIVRKSKSLEGFNSNIGLQVAELIEWQIF